MLSSKSSTLFILFLGILSKVCLGTSSLFDSTLSCCSGTPNSRNLADHSSMSMPMSDSDSNSMPGMSMMGDSYWDMVRGKPFDASGRVRSYYIAAEEVIWDYAPDGHNVITGLPWGSDEALYTTRDATKIGTRYIKCLYKQYTDSSFTVKLARSQSDKHLGFMGPTIRAEVGDTINVYFYNKCKFPATIHVHGVFYYKDSEGAPYNDTTTSKDKKDDAVPPGEKYTYVWKVPERAGPGQHDGSSVMWMYHSHAHEVIDFYAGLVGNMVIVRKGMMGRNGRATDLDQEVFWMFSASNENQSPYLEDNIRRFTLGKNVTKSKSDPNFSNSNTKFAINGYIYGNGPLLTLKKNSRVRFYLMSMGGGRDIHTPHWHGNVVLLDGMRMDVASLLPAEMVVADMSPDAVGIWLQHCHVHEHFVAGMINRYQVVE